MKKTNKHNQKKGNQYVVIILSVILIAIVAVIYVNKDSVSNKGGSSDDKKKGKAIQNEAGDLLIPIQEVSSTASFYKAKVEDTEIEVLAIKAPDGTVRTAFNTCQVCFDSGRGYYKQSGDRLVCQNCGNQFTAADVEVSKGGCNPIPITKEYKTVDTENITVSNEYLKRAKTIFENWKAN